MDWRHLPPIEHPLVGYAPPPQTFTDLRGRKIDLHLYGNGPSEDEYEALLEMYQTFPLEHRSLGLPPVGAKRIRKWLDILLKGECILAWHGDRVIGQACLVYSGHKEAEFTIFIYPDYHGSRIGTRLTETTLSHGQDSGLKRVWLLVERANQLAVSLYQEVGFFITESHGYDLEMAINL